MGKGKGKGKDAQDSLDNSFYMIGMILFVISLVVFIVQLSAGPSTPVEKNTTVTIGNETSVISYSGCRIQLKYLIKRIIRCVKKYKVVVVTIPPQMPINAPTGVA